MYNELINLSKAIKASLPQQFVDSSFQLSLGKIVWYYMYKVSHTTYSFQPKTPFIWGLYLLTKDIYAMSSKGIL